MCTCKADRFKGVLVDPDCPRGHGRTTPDRMATIIARLRDEDGDGKLTDTSLAWLRGWNACLDTIEEELRG